MGHCAFVFEDESGGRILIDPFDNSESDNWFLKPFPPIDVDLVAVTHDHFDHNAVGRLPRNAEVIDSEERRSVGSTRIVGIEDLHAGPSGERGMTNVIYIVDHDGVRYCHLGDNRPDIPSDVQDALGKVDVLMIPVDDSCHLLTYDEVGHVIDLLTPNVVVPMHYSIEGLTTPESTLLGIDRWARLQGRRRPLRQSSIRIDRRGMPYEREVWLVPGELGESR